jgi:hypothetical protein
LLAATLNAIVVERPECADGQRQHLCLDKAYDNSTGYGLCEEHNYAPHIRRIGEEKLDQEGQKAYPARRWVVERTFDWLSRCRAILIRWDKKVETYLAQVKLACVLLWFRRLHKAKAQVAVLL